MKSIPENCFSWDFISLIISKTVGETKEGTHSDKNVFYDFIFLPQSKRHSHKDNPSKISKISSNSKDFSAKNPEFFIFLAFFEATLI